MEMLDHTHTLAHYIHRNGPVEWAGSRDGSSYQLYIAVAADRYWRLLTETQDIRDAVRRGRHSGVLLTDRPIALQRYDHRTTAWLLGLHAVLGEMLIDGEPMYVWSRGAVTGRNELVEIRRYAYEPEEFQRRARDAGIEVPSLVPTRKRDQRRPW